MSKAFVREFIELYRSLPCLWKVKSKDYTDRLKKDAAYKKMIAKLREIDPSADREAVIKKINSLRSNYRKELKKVIASKKSGASTEEIYVPSLWYFPLLRFLNDELSGTAIGTCEDIKNQSSETLSSYVQVQHQSTSSMPDVGFGASFPKRHQSTKRKMDKVLTSIERHLATSPFEDRFDVFGRNIAFKLRNLSNEQRIYAEKIINDAIFEAELGNLNKKCYLHTCTNVITDTCQYKANIQQN